MWPKREDLTPPGSDVRYLVRWVLFRWGGRVIYLHKIESSDWAREPHDHPKWFVSIGLWGSYMEEVYEANITPRSLMCVEHREWRAPWFRKFPATHIHRLLITKGVAWTLVFTGKHTQDWGFYDEQGNKTLYAEFVARHQSAQRAERTYNERTQAQAETYSPIFGNRH